MMSHFWLIFWPPHSNYLLTVGRSTCRTICHLDITYKLSRVKISSLHWTILILFYAIFLQWSIIMTKSKRIPVPPPSPKFSHFKRSNYYFACSNTLNLQTFLTISMTSEIESSKPYCFTPLYENAQKWERKTSMETTKFVWQISYPLQMVQV